MAYIYNRRDQKELRRKLRKSEPVTERLLWSKLRNRYLLGFKFRRQYGIGPFVVDYCCPDTKLVIELDGDSHYVSDDAKNNDLKRQQYIEDLDFTVLRFTNRDIMENVAGVLEIIANHLNK